MTPQAPDSSSAKILVVDDSSVDRETVAIVCSQLSSEIETAANGLDAIRLFRRNRHDLVICDYRMEPMSGLEVLSELRAIDPTVSCLLMTGSPDPNAIAYAQDGEAGGLITKPIAPRNLLSRAIVALGRLAGRTEPSHRVAISNRMDKCLPLRGVSPAVQKVRAEIQALAEVCAPIVVDGPVGSGKPEIAELLHQNGHFGMSVCIDCHCLRLSSDQLESSLIDSDGRFGQLLKMARDGTLILHNLEALPMPLQAALAKKLPEISERTHLIATVDGCFENLFEEGMIDSNLFFKLSANLLKLPYLRNRKEDVPEIVEAAALLGATGNDSKAVRLDLVDDFLASIRSWDYEGNVVYLLKLFEEFCENRDLRGNRHTAAS